MISDQIVIRNCTTLEEFHLCVALQKDVWGFSDAELVPLRIFSLAPKIGGQVVGAWDGETFVGFAMAIPGNRHGRPYLHSHMVAVIEDHRNTGLGRKLKLFQRDDAITRGYELMEWTFDPLEIKNSYFNLERLGAIARRYNVNQYGITNSPLQGSLPTDRLVAEWWMNSQRVTSLLCDDHRRYCGRSARRSAARDLCMESRSRQRAARRKTCRRAIATTCNRRLPGACHAWPTSAIRRATAASCSASGTKTCRTLQIPDSEKRA